METAIKRAQSVGWIATPLLGKKATDRSYWASVVLLPSFWQALGKAEGWGAARDVSVNPGTPEYSNWVTGHSWGWYWHRFIDHLAEGKDADSFFKSLLK